MFAERGFRVQRAHVVVDKITRESKGYGFAEFQESDLAVPGETEGTVLLQGEPILVSATEPLKRLVRRDRLADIRSTFVPAPGVALPIQRGQRVGSLVFLANIILLTLYAFSCHSLRHLVGGKLDCFSCTAAAKSRHGIWKKASFLNERHMLFAWCSLISVGFADFYVWMVAAGYLKDIRIL